MQIHEISVYIDATEFLSFGSNAYFRPYILVGVT